MKPAADKRPAKTRITPIPSRITFSNRVDHFLARWGINRSGHSVTPGLYALGSPTPDSPVFVTANYTLSFDGLRSALTGLDGYILVLDTKAINVWCASGKGTFGTHELVFRIETTGLKDIVRHRVLILPQLGASGVSAHEVKKRSGFRVEYGPVRAKDLPEYVKTHQATSEMRRVRFTWRDRLILIPVELVYILLPMLILAGILYFVNGVSGSLGVVASTLTGVVLFPILLPWIPTRNFSTKGFILGGIPALVFALTKFLSGSNATIFLRAGWALIYLLAMPAWTAFLTLNFTGSTPFTSRSGVKHEIYTYVPRMAWMVGGSLVLTIALILIRVFGGAG